MARAGNSPRPIVVLKKYNQYSFLALPLTTVPQPNPYRLAVGMVDGRPAFATLSQLRNIDSKRLVKKIARLDTNIFIAIKKEASRVNFG
jgi:mRNA-degrading endonuclease toxin of MazEF toxin-antitoxin module